MKWSKQKLHNLGLNVEFDLNNVVSTVLDFFTSLNNIIQYFSIFVFFYYKKTL